MQMKKLSGYQRYLALAAIGAAFGVAGCASVPPPTEQLAVTRSAIANALSAGGSEHAAAEMRSAQDKLDRASRAMAREDYAEARMLAEASQADARLAEKKAQAAKAERAARVTQDDNRVLREEMNRKPR